MAMVEKLIPFGLGHGFNDIFHWHVCHQWVLGWIPHTWARSGPSTKQLQDDRQIAYVILGETRVVRDLATGLADWASVTDPPLFAV